jgi:hypothetical protein
MCPARAVYPGRQTNPKGVLNHLEKEHPGITRVKRDSTGTIVIEDFGFDLDRLIQEIKEELSEPAPAFNPRH